MASTLNNHWTYPGQGAGKCCHVQTPLRKRRAINACRRATNSSHKLKVASEMLATSLGERAFRPMQVCFCVSTLNFQWDYHWKVRAIALTPMPPSDIVFTGSDMATTKRQLHRVSASPTQRWFPYKALVWQRRFR